MSVDLVEVVEWSGITQGMMQQVGRAVRASRNRAAIRVSQRFVWIVSSDICLQ